MSFLGNIFGAAQGMTQEQHRAIDVQLQISRGHFEWAKTVFEHQQADRGFERWHSNTLSGLSVLSAASRGYEAGKAERYRRERLSHCCNCGAPLHWGVAALTTCCYCKSEHHA